MASDAHKVVATAGLISVGVGSANAVFKDHRPPTAKFLIGSGVAYLVLSVLADASPDLAKGLAIGVATTVVMGEGGGVLSYINTGEMDTAKRPHKTLKKAEQDFAATVVPDVTVTPLSSRFPSGTPVVTGPAVPGRYKHDTPNPFPGIVIPIRPGRGPARANQ